MITHMVRHNLQSHLLESHSSYNLYKLAMAEGVNYLFSVSMGTPTAVLSTCSHTTWVFTLNSKSNELTLDVTEIG